ncbi:MAG: UDP-N-acetylglucosamine--N-acetylmuramyl-(pentapeptide) pyrophosphoryl-undecaprenol N-acetylglucosamine transferase, partial [Actinobacteria bacterium]
MTGYAFAAAGTGGHVYPALAVADALVERGADPEDVVFFGGDRMEAAAVPEAGYPFVRLEIHGLRRSASPRNVALPILVRRSAAVVQRELLARGTMAMAVFGGYITGPAVLGANRARVPVLIHEQNAVPGLANRLARRSARRVMVAFEPATSVLRGSSVVGNPLRRQIAALDTAAVRGEALLRYEVAGERPVLGVAGGSQGAGALNNAVAALLADRSLDIDVIHLTGRQHLAAISAAAAGDERWHPFGFEERMDLFYAACDLVLARSGAMTVSELAVTGTPSVLVPLPAGRGYQGRNASDLERAGGTVVLPQDRIGDAMAAVIELLGDPPGRERM